MFRKPCISRESTKRRLIWAKHAWRKEDTMIKAVIKEDPIENRPQRRPRLRCEDCGKWKVKAVDSKSNRKKVAEDRERWKKICCTGWSLNL
ncbi:Hypothetical protein CINCED_3A020733 [Cinara cedri]|uniref:Uncharacterized protein n=1 Tax=Cinara cedri TaxID=506608 RepID=A0A5E4NIT0_9HEMI|nr:Hypothetical protein CINCED_3A020733 [Cinara cedri]